MAYANPLVQFHSEWTANPSDQLQLVGPCLPAVMANERCAIALRWGFGVVHRRRATPPENDLICLFFLI